MDVFPSGGGGRKFTDLNDGIMRRKYVIADIYVASGKRFNVIEVEREDRSLSILILSSNKIKEWNYIYKKLLLSHVTNSGVWSSQSLQNLENEGVDFRKMKHSKKNNRYRAELLMNKLIQ